MDKNGQAGDQLCQAIETASNLAVEQGDTLVTALLAEAMEAARCSTSATDRGGRAPLNR